MGIDERIDLRGPVSTSILRGMSIHEGEVKVEEIVGEVITKVFVLDV
jgi:hypothetical protein